MKDLETLLKKYKKLLAIFPHPDDESFVAGGLFQVSKDLDIKTYLLCLTKGERGKNGLKIGNLKKIREKELIKAKDILKIDELISWKFPDACLRKSKKMWVNKTKDVIEKIKPDIIVTLDHSGITGHPDHIVSCHEILKIIKKLKRKPTLLWRVPDEQEKTYFKENKALIHASKANYILDFGFLKSLNKIKAIFAHKSQVTGIGFRLQILEWYLFDQKELYYKVDLRKMYKYRFVEYKF